jgi:hypothetical protein
MRIKIRGGTSSNGPKKNDIGFVKRTELTRRERFVLDGDESLEEDV